MQDLQQSKAFQADKGIETNGLQLLIKKPFETPCLFIEE